MFFALKHTIEAVVVSVGWSLLFFSCCCCSYWKVRDLTATVEVRASDKLSSVQMYYFTVSVGCNLWTKSPKIEKVKRLWLLCAVEMFLCASKILSRSVWRLLQIDSLLSLLVGAVALIQWNICDGRCPLDNLSHQPVLTRHTQPCNI